MILLCLFIVVIVLSVGATSVILEYWGEQSCSSESDH